MTCWFYFEGNTNLKNADDVRKSFFDRYIQNQNTVKELLKSVSAKKWMCDKKNFPGTELTL